MDDGPQFHELLRKRQAPSCGGQSLFVFHVNL